MNRLLKTALTLLGIGGLLVAVLAAGVQAAPQPNARDIDIHPLSFQFALPVGSSAVKPLIVANTGDAPVIWGLSVAAGGTAVDGRWIVYYDWGCIGEADNTAVVFYPDHTFDTNTGGGGTWTQSANRLTWTYDNGTEYTGFVAGRAMAGTVANTAGATGCWEAKREAILPAKVFAAPRRVLWDLTHGVHLDYRPAGQYASLAALLGSAGYALNTTAAGVDHVTLADYDTLVVGLGSAWDTAYTPAEVAVIQTFVANGGGLLVLCDSPAAPNAHVQPVAGAFGVTCGTAAAGSALVSEMTRHAVVMPGVELILPDEGGVLGTVPPAQAVAWTPSAQVLVAAADWGAGRVAVLGDIDAFNNATLPLVDNAAFAVNTFDWLAAPWLSAQPSTGTPSPGSSDTVRVAVDRLEPFAGEYGLVIIRSDDPDEALIAVPVSLSLGHWTHLPMIVRGQ